MPTPPLQAVIATTTTDQSGCTCSSDPCGCGTDCKLGMVDLQETPVSTPHSGFSYSFYNLFTQSGSAANPDFGMGTNVLVEGWAYATTAPGGLLAFIWSATKALWFDSGTLAPQFGSRYQLTVVGSQYRILDPVTGAIYLFDQTTGLLVSTTTAGGQSTVNTISGNQITQTVRSLNYTEGGVNKTTTEAWLFTYYPAGGGSSNRLQYATLARPNDSAYSIRRLAMDYYNAGDASGNAGNLRTVSVQVPSGGGWQTIATNYYRYYTQDYDGTPNTQPGYVNGLKAIVKPDGFAQLSLVTDPYTAPDSLVVQYAAANYQYTALSGGSNVRRVTLSITGGGGHTHAFVYTTSAFAQNYNNWYLKTVATHDDGSQKITFSNFVGQMMLTDLWADPAHQSTGRWIEHVKYHVTYARPTEQYTPEAINMNASKIYDETVGNLAVALNTATGLVNLTAYFASGPGASYPEGCSLKQGTTGTPSKLHDYEYTKVTSGGDFLVYPSQDTTYLDDAGATSTATSYVRTFFGGNPLQTQTQTTTLPQIPTSQNGRGVDPTPGVPLYISVVTLDLQGRLIQRTDPYDSRDGSARQTWTAFQFDEPTGALVRLIQDAAQSSPPTHGELMLTTDVKVDDLGRTVQTLGPAFNSNGQMVRAANWNVYQDVNHETWSGQGYAAGNNDGPQYTFTLVNPVSITRMDPVGRVTDQISAVRSTTSGALSAADSFPQSTWVRWASNLYNLANEVAASRIYFSIPASGAGSPNVNYNEATFGHDHMCRQNMTRTPDGTITRTVHDVRNLPTSVYVGTADLGATDDVPDAHNAAGNNMILVASYTFDSGNPVGGNGNLTAVRMPLDTTANNDRLTNYTNDFRNRRTQTSAFITISPAKSVVAVNTIDNLDRVTQVDQYDTTVAAANLINQSKTYYDFLGHAFKTEVYGVTIGTGASTNPQATNSWFDGKGFVIKQQPAGSQAYTKTQYDPIGRPTGTYLGYALGGETFWTIGSGDKIFEQATVLYDGASHAVQTVAYQRNDNASPSDVGPLTSSNARVSYSGIWLDGVGRQTAMANYGTASFDRTLVTAPPPSNATVLVSLVGYNDRGEAFQTTDPAGMVTQSSFDDFGRSIETVQNYSAACSRCGDTNVTTKRTYTADGQIATLTVVNAATGDQTTRYFFGTTRAATDFTTVARNDLLVAEIYPDAADATDQVNYMFNRQGDHATMRDQNGTVHAYMLDGLRRRTRDTVTTLGSGVDPAVRRIDTAYDIRGMINKVTSFSDTAGTSAVNEVVLAYNNFSQLTSDGQNHSGSGGSPPAVGYAYENGSANTTRRTTVTYANGRTLAYNYPSGDDKLSRLQKLTLAGTDVAAYTFLGRASVVQVDYPEPGINWSVITTGGGDRYARVDSFGRVIDHPWTKATTGDLAELKYGYNQVSNRTYRNDVKATSAGAAFDELYSHDGMHRLADFGRGTLNGGNTAITTNFALKEGWRLDATGNWAQFEHVDQSSGAAALDQSRTANRANEIALITNSVGPAWAQPAYDRSGNMTNIPKPSDPTGAYAGTYDAWQRLVKLMDGGSTVATHAYDGLMRRTTKTASGTTRHFYYSDLWQVLEERLGASATPDRQFVWGSRYIDDLVLRDRSNGGTLNERLYSLQDANWNVSAISDNAGAVQERYSYTAYGVSTVLAPTFTVRGASSYDWETRYAGDRSDSESGLAAVRFRYLHPTLGVWLARDDRGRQWTNTNLYLYVLARPLTLVDPFGREEIPPSIAIQIGIQLGNATTYDEAFVAMEALAAILAGLYGINITAKELLRRYGHGRFQPPQIIVPRVVPNLPDIPPTGLTPEEVESALETFVESCRELARRIPKPDTGPDPRPIPGDIPIDPPPIGPRDEKDEPCAKEYPGWHLCSQYDYKSYEAAANAKFQRPFKTKPGDARKCGAGGGKHWNIYKNKTLVGSIICCNCCEEVDGKAVKRTRCNVN